MEPLDKQEISWRPLAAPHLHCAPSNLTVIWSFASIQLNVEQQVKSTPLLIVYMSYVEERLLSPSTMCSRVRKTLTEFVVTTVAPSPVWFGHSRHGSRVSIDDKFIRIEILFVTHQ